MPLSEPASRKLIHTRSVTCQAYQRNDGLWDIEGHMTDIKSHDMANEDRGGLIPAGEPVHEMWLRLTITEQLEIQNAEASTEYAPFDLCPAITKAYSGLKGIRIGPGWNKKVKAMLSGTAGCTHHTELLGPMATTAFQALYKVLSEKEQQQGKPPAILNTCHALSATSPVAKRLWPDWYQQPTDQTS